MKECFVSYEQFGAIGDGVHNDFFAMKAAHDYANECGLTVRADTGRTYLIRETVADGEVLVISVRTNVIFGDSKIIIDDTDLSFYSPDGMAKRPVFSIEPTYPMRTETDSTLLGLFAGVGEGTDKLPLSLGYPAMLVIYNEEHNVFRRFGGYSAKDGTAQKELIVIDANGNVDPSTPFMFDYPKVTRIDIYRTDDEPITVSGGSFITRASRENIFPIDPETGERRVIGGYFSRCIKIARSHTTLSGVKHYIEGEYTVKEQAELGVGGTCYGGFFNASYADEITLENCVLTGRRCYRRPNGGTGGTYDFSAAMVNKIRLIGCTQSNFFVDQTTGIAPTEDSRAEDIVFSMSRSEVSGSMICWGIGGTNFCKNMEYIGCTLSRFDAHQGLYNGLIKDSTLNFMELTGKGEMRIEGMKWYSPGPGETYNSLIYLRSDYGSTWEGTVTVKDTTAYVSKGDTYIFSHNYANWDFGYTCYFPNLVIDGLRYENLETGASIHLFTESRSAGREPMLHTGETVNVPFVGEDGEKRMINKNPIVPPHFVKVRNSGGLRLQVTDGLDFFENTEFIYE